MKRNVGFLLAAIGVFAFCCTGVFAQSCTPLDPLPPGTFIYPLPYSVANPQGGIQDTAFVGVPYETTIHLNLPDSLFIQGIGMAPITGLFLGVEGGIEGLPPSMDYVCDPPDCLFLANVPGCINVFGTANGFEPGIYDITLTGLVSPAVIQSFNLPSPEVLEGNYYLFVKICPVNEVFVTLEDGILTAEAAIGAFQWIDCADGQPIAGETGASFLPPVTGDYAVIVSNGGCQDTSACFHVVVNGVHERGQGFGMRLSPNPTNDRLRIELEWEMAFVKVTIGGIRGETAFTKICSNGRVLDIDVSGFAAGLYLVSIWTEEGVVVGRFFKGK